MKGLSQAALLSVKQRPELFNCCETAIVTFQFLMWLKEAENINELLKSYFSRSVPSCCKGILSVCFWRKKTVKCSG